MGLDPPACRSALGAASPLTRTPPPDSLTDVTHKVFSMPVASVYPHYVVKVERKGRTREELDEVITWLTGYEATALADHLSSGTTFEDFFAAAELNPNASLITGTVCGVRVEDVSDPLMQKIRYLDKLVDELAKGKSLDKVLRR